MVSAGGSLVFEWRGPFTNAEVNRLHAEAFETRLLDESEWNWRELTARHSRGWVTARRGEELVGFANEAARAGCDFLHVDFEERLQQFYIDECGFSAVRGGLMRLSRRSA